MATDLTSSNINALLKKAYAAEFFAAPLYKTSPLFGILSKITKGGENMVQPLTIGGSQNISSTFTTAIAGTHQSVNKRFTIDYADLFANIVINNKEVKAAKSKGPEAFVNALLHETSLAMKELSKDFSQSLYRKSTGVRATIGSVATAVYTLATPQDIVMFPVGAKIIASVNADGSSPRDSGAAKTVVGINQRLGTITLSGAISGAVAGDFFFRDGDASLRINGLLDWIPHAGDRGSLGSPFLGVTRSVDEYTLAGIARDGSGSSFEEALIDAESELFSFGSAPNYIMINPADYANLSKELASKEQINKGGASASSASIAYDTISIAGITAEMIRDPHCPKGFAFFLDTDQWYLGHLDRDVINDWDLDSLKFERSSSFDGATGRLVSYSNLVCMHPGSNLVLTLP